MHPAGSAFSSDINPRKGSPSKTSLSNPDGLEKVGRAPDRPSRIQDTANIEQQQRDDGSHTGLHSGEQVFMKTAQLMRGNVYVCTLSAEDVTHRHGNHYRHPNTPSVLEPLL